VATSPVTVGVLALQGAFALHREALERCGADVVEVRKAEHLEGLDGLVIPGGESTTISKLLETFALTEPVAKAIADDLAIFGTCAGMILLASEVEDGRSDQISFGAIDISVRRNGYGRQIDSFESDLVIDELGSDPLRAIFIRAPVVTRVGPGVEVLAEVDGVPVLCRQGAVMVSSFHPELTNDDRLHQRFIHSIG